MTDVFSFRAVILIVGAIALASIGTGLWLLVNKQREEALVAFGIGSTALALLSPSPLSKAKTEGQVVEETVEP